MQEDASGVQEFFYGNLGELTKNVRTFVMPNSNPLTFAMEFNYDSWNRITQMIYPDGERVHYQYDNGGQLKAVFGDKQTENGQEDYVYVEDIKYDRYGSRSEILYGNGIQTTYTYEPLRRRLTQLQGIDTNTGEIVQNVEYDYDAADNIKEVIKSADRGVNGLSYTHSMYYEYDEMYRLKEASHGASGGFSNGSDYASLEGYSLTYSPSGNITSKSVAASILTPAGNVGVYYGNTYNYNGRPHAISSISGAFDLEFEWDGSGNMIRHTDNEMQTHRRMRWDEENRLKAVYDSEQRLSSYLYDAGGERTLKMSGSYQSTYINSSLTISSVNMTDYTLYTSPYMVMTDNEYTKHYYVEADRVASKIGGGMANNITGINDVVIGFEMQSEENYLQKNNDVLDMMTNDFNELEVHASIEVFTNTEFWEGEALGQNGSEGDLIYFFHKDHLGSSTQISDISANIIHHVEYMPFGETFVEQRSNWGTNYKFNGKELDEETGFYYYGARYYNPDISIWLSVDPLSDKYPSMSPYMYCAGNPVILVDPDGRSFDHFTIDTEGNLKLVEHRPNEGFHVIFRKEDYDTGKRDYDDTGTKSGMKINKSEIKFFESKIAPIKCPWEDLKMGETNTFEIGLSNPVTAKNLYEFLTSSSKFEFSNQWFERGTQTLNVLYTALQEDQVPGNISRARKYKAQGWIYTRSDHNHPNNNPNPSGFPGGKRGDIPNKELVLREFPNVEFNVYTPSNRKYTSY